MNIDIPHRYTNAVLYHSDTAETICAALEEAIKTGASLDHASLVGARLVGARLDGASLVGTTGINSWCVTPLRILLVQPGSIRAYKIVDGNGNSPLAAEQGFIPIHYEVGGSYDVPDVCTDETKQCAAGISLATLDWILYNWGPGQRVLLVEHTAADIAAIPIATDGKYRVRRCKIVEELDLRQYGPGPWAEQAPAGGQP